MIVFKYLAGQIFFLTARFGAVNTFAHRERYEAKGLSEAPLPAPRARCQVAKLGAARMSAGSAPPKWAADVFPTHLPALRGLTCRESSRQGCVCSLR